MQVSGRFIATDLDCGTAGVRFHTVTATGPWSRWVCAATWRPMGEIRATLLRVFRKLRRFTAIAHYYPVGGVSQIG